MRHPFGIRCSPPVKRRPCLWPLDTVTSTAAGASSQVKSNQEAHLISIFDRLLIFVFGGTPLWERA